MNTSANAFENASGESSAQSQKILRAMGDVNALDSNTLDALNSRATSRNADVIARTAEIVEQVRSSGDVALRELARRFDRVELDEFEISRAECERALNNIDAPLRASLERAAANIATVHRAFLPTAIEVSPEPGITIGRRPDPLARVGVYAPGGRAAYPSSLLMGAIPARVAGVKEIIVCSPPSANGAPSQIVLAAAALANVNRIFAIGGAGAIAAMAFGTTQIPRVDRIVGPGNAYVAEAKLQLAGTVAIDAPAGPSELLVVADHTAQPSLIAREMIAQAEHDPDAAVITIVFGERSSTMIAEIESCLRDALASTARADIARTALALRGAILSVRDEASAIEFANQWAAEHLLLLVHDSRVAPVRDQLRSVGAVFVGSSSSVAFGDYMTGANHVLPTAGSARSFSGLSTLDFFRWTSWQQVSPDAAASLAHDVGVFADAEGLPAHAIAARAWSQGTQAQELRV